MKKTNNTTNYTIFDTTEDNKNLSFQTTVTGKEELFKYLRENDDKYFFDNNELNDLTDKELYDLIDYHLDEIEYLKVVKA